MTQFSDLSRTQLIDTLQDYEKAISADGAEKARILYELPLHQVELEIQCRDLIESQHALEEARDRYAELFDFAPVGYLSLDRNGLIHDLNLTASAMLGKERAVLRGLPFRSYLASDSRRPFFALLQRAFLGDGPVTGEFSCAAGRRVQLDCLLHGGNNGEGRCLTVLTDITERKKAEDILQGEKAFLQHLIDGIDDPILVIAPDFQILRMNAAARRVAEASGLNGPCMSCHQVTHRSEKPCAGDDHPCPLKVVLRTRQPTRVIHNHVTPDGTMRKFEVAVSPLFNDAGDVLGVIEVNRDISDHVELLEELDNRDRRFEHLAQHDVLTDLPNRALFADRLSQAMHAANRNGERVGLLFLDLDRFKEINDSFDHSTGDQVLVEVASRLRGTFRENDTIARMGGDEFIIVLSDIKKAEDAGQVAHKVLQLFDTPFRVRNRTLHLGASIGISVYPDHGDTVEELVRNADSAMYEAKAAGRKGFHYYSRELTERALKRIALESALHDAVSKDEFIIHYQPQFDLDSGRVAGLEALVRWQVDADRVELPGLFIDVAEEAGLIVDIDRMVMRKACAQMKAWIDAGQVADDVSLSVNLSSRMFDSDDLLDTVCETLRETQLDPARLELELTESSMMRNVSQSACVLKNLRDHGVRIAVDDFGTGYSSLAYLKALPITRLKIDQMFVSKIPGDSDDMAIAEAIISLAETLSLDLLAEGVESLEQKDFLLQRGCCIGQGYWFSRPLPVAELEQFLQVSR